MLYFDLYSVLMGSLFPFYNYGNLSLGDSPKQNFARDRLFLNEWLAAKLALSNYCMIRP